MGKSVEWGYRGLGGDVVYPYCKSETCHRVLSPAESPPSHGCLGTYRPPFRSLVALDVLKVRGRPTYSGGPSR